MSPIVQQPAANNSNTLRQPEVDNSDVVWRLAAAAFAARALHVVAEIGVADHVTDSPRTAASLAADIGADPDALDRILRLLATQGVFTLTPAGWTHNGASELLRSDAPMSMRAFARMLGLPMTWSSLTELEFSVRTGRAGAERLDPDGVWGYLRKHQDETEIFAEAMTAKSAQEIASVLAVYDFGRFDVIADIGGGRGHFLRAILETTDITGILFDQPDVIASVDAHPQIALRSGDFFRDDLPAADAYLLLEVIHDWADPEATAILAAIRRAAVVGATVLIIEAVLPDAQLDERAHTLDVIMLAVTGGRERTAAQLSQLLNLAGFRLDRVTDTASSMRIVEATAV